MLVQSENTLHISRVRSSPGIVDGPIVRPRQGLSILIYSWIGCGLPRERYRNA